MFWASLPTLPPGLHLERNHEFLFAPRPGPGGNAAFELVTLKAPASDSHLLVAYKAPLAAKDVPALKRRLTGLLEEKRRRATSPEDRVQRFPVVATDSAQPAVREACEREWLGLIDQRGTVVIHDGPVYVHVEGLTRAKSNPRATLFRGKGARVVRFLLAHLDESHSVLKTAFETETSNAYASAVLRRLEEDGYVQRRSERSGFRLIRPAELLRAWSEAAPKNTALVEPFYAPSTTAADFERLTHRLDELASPYALTLQSAVPSADQVTAGVPHGLYLAGDLRPVIEALGLRKTTPHNFLVLRPEPEAATTRFGVFAAGQRKVATPQLVLDLLAFGGARGREQSDAVRSRWEQSLPLIEANDG